MKEKILLKEKAPEDPRPLRIGWIVHARSFVVPDKVGAAVATLSLLAHIPNRPCTIRTAGPLTRGSPTHHLIAIGPKEVWG